MPGAGRHVCYDTLNLASNKELETTVTELKAMAKAANSGKTL